MREQILETLRSHAAGQLNKHKMNVEIYLNYPVGVGEHSDIMETIESELKQVAEYQDQLDILDKYFK
jgi:hypothetical protein